MSVKIGDSLPSVRVHRLGSDGPEAVQSGDILQKGKIVLFAIPGAFTPTCSDGHFPGYMEHAGALRAKGIDQIVCMASNDPFVIDAWGKKLGVNPSHITMLCDGNGDFARALGVQIDASPFGLGQRSGRYAMVLEDGVIQQFHDEKGVGLTCSRAQNILDHL